MCLELWPGDGGASLSAPGSPPSLPPTTLPSLTLSSLSRSHVLSWAGVKVGLLGLVEREWLLTIPSLDESDIAYLDFVEEGRRLARQLWETEVRQAWGLWGVWVV